MKVIIMCGGVYDNFKKPKALSIINGETLVERTLRLLKEHNISDIYISSNDEIFNQYGKVLHHPNSYKYEGGKIYGYWVDAYYPTDEPCIYLHGDVYYTDAAMEKILNLHPSVNTFIGNEIARNPEHKNWGEPFGWIVVNQQEFRRGIEETKRLQDEGKLERGFAISWELYRVLNNLDPNKQYINDETYLSINDETIDVDEEWQIEELNERLQHRNN